MALFFAKPQTMGVNGAGCAAGPWCDTVEAVVGTWEADWRMD